ncbi:MAG: hypothetical protein ABR907_02530 [Terracidiphilus sp.]|jgi:hypothetical protein
MSQNKDARLHRIAEVQALIAAGKNLFLAGSREALSELPQGNWVGGTICYFMTDEGGQVSEDKIFVTEAPEFAREVRIAEYDRNHLAEVYKDAPDNGFSYLLLPSSPKLLKSYAEDVSSFDGFLMHTVVGWVAGVRVDRIGAEMPAVFNGKTGAVLEDKCVALHVSLPTNKMAELDIVNIFKGGAGEVIRFKEEGFQAVGCMIDGKPANLAEYIAANGINTEFPLVGDYNGSSINVSIQKVDAAAHTVDLYAPVFPGVEYRFAEPVEDYARAFAEVVGVDQAEPEFACNCILNFLYGKLEGKKTGSVTGPITFGEIAHQLLNQTLVRLYLRDV